MFDVGYQYDEKGNVIGITYPGNFGVNYVYDKYGRVTGIPGFVEEGGSTGATDPKPDPGVNPITDPAPDPGILSVPGVFSFPATPLPGVEYQANSSMKVLRFANGLTTTYDYDTLGRIRTI